MNLFLSIDQKIKINVIIEISEAEIKDRGFGSKLKTSLRTEKNYIEVTDWWDKGEFNGNFHSHSIQNIVNRTKRVCIRKHT